MDPFRLVSTVDIDALQKVLETINKAVAELNKALHSLRRRKQACPHEIDSCIALKSDACAMAQMGQCIQKGGAGLSWDGFEVLQTEFLNIAFVDDVPLRFKTLALMSHANDLLRFGKYTEIHTLLNSGHGLSAHFDISELQDQRACIVEAMLCRVLQITKRKQDTFDILEAILALVEPMCRANDFFTQPVFSEYRRLVLALQPKESLQYVGLDQQHAIITKLIADSASKRYGGVLKGVFVMPAFMQCLTARLATVEQEVETSNKVGSLREACRVMQSSISLTEMLDDVLNNKSEFDRFAALLAKALAYTTAVGEKHAHKKEFDDLCNDITKWASTFFWGHSNQEFERFFEKALDDTVNLGMFVAECVERHGKLAEVHNTLAELLPVSCRRKGSEWDTMVESGRGVLKIIVQCRAIVELSGEASVTEVILANVAGKQQVIGDTIAKMEPPLPATLRDAYQKWKLLNPIRTPAYALYKQNYAEAKLPVVEQVPAESEGFLHVAPPVHKQTQHTTTHQPNTTQTQPQQQTTDNNNNNNNNNTNTQQQ